jgi:hypothetical protein
MGLNESFVPNQQFCSHLVSDLLTDQKRLLDNVSQQYPRRRVQFCAVRQPSFSEHEASLCRVTPTNQKKTVDTPKPSAVRTIEPRFMIERMLWAMTTISWLPLVNSRDFISSIVAFIVRVRP